MLVKSLLLTVAGTLLIVAPCGAPAQAQATRTWVSGVGDDVNPCSRTAPCKTFAGAISKTAAAGEINCMDPGGFGAVTITKSITIDCGATLGSILASGTNGIVINATTASVVRLRNLSIQGAGTGITGIRWIGSAGQLHVENVRIMAFTTKGIEFIPTGAGELYVTDTSISEVGGSAVANAAIFVRPTGTFANAVISRVSANNNAGGVTFQSDGMPAGGRLFGSIADSVLSGGANNGVNLPGTAATIMRVQIVRSLISANGTNGVIAGGNVVVQLLGTVVTQNTTGLSGATITSFQSNVLSGNDTNGAATSTVPLQ